MSDNKSTGGNRKLTRERNPHRKSFRSRPTPYLSPFREGVEELDLTMKEKFHINVDKLLYLSKSKIPDHAHSHPFHQFQRHALLEAFNILLSEPSIHLFLCV